MHTPKDRRAFIQASANFWEGFGHGFACGLISIYKLIGRPNHLPTHKHKRKNTLVDWSGGNDFWEQLCKR